MSAVWKDKTEARLLKKKHHRCLKHMLHLNCHLFLHRVTEQQVSKIIGRLSHNLDSMILWSICLQVFVKWERMLLRPGAFTSGECAENLTGQFLSGLWSAEAAASVDDVERLHCWRSGLVHKRGLDHPLLQDKQLNIYQRSASAIMTNCQRYNNNSQEQKPATWLLEFRLHKAPCWCGAIHESASPNLILSTLSLCFSQIPERGVRLEAGDRQRGHTQTLRGRGTAG